MSTPAPPVVHPTWGEVARRPRMVGLLVALLALAAVFGALGKWQLDRAYERGAASHARQVAAQRAAEEAKGPEALGDVLPPQTTFTNSMIGTLAHASGTFDASRQLLVRGRALDGVPGYLVLTPLRVSDDGTGGASWAGLSGEPVLPVVRGWVADPADVPDPPTGTVDVTGYLQASEATVPDDGLPAGETNAISSGALANRWGGPIYAGYLVVRDPADVVSDAAAGAAASLRALPRPVAEGAGGVNYQSLSYAFQWWLFACFAVFVWWRIVRDQRDGERSGGAEIVGLPALADPPQARVDAS